MIYTLSLHDALPISVAFLVGEGRAADEAAGRENPPVELRVVAVDRSEEHTSELQSQSKLVCRLLLEKNTEASPHSLPTPFGLAGRQPESSKSLHEWS